MALGPIGSHLLPAILVLEGELCDPRAFAHQSWLTALMPGVDSPPPDTLVLGTLPWPLSGPILGGKL